MLERLSSEQRARVASLIQKHSQQMLELIAEKLTSLEVCCITNCLTSFIKLISRTDGETGHRSVVNNGEAGVAHQDTGDNIEGNTYCVSGTSTDLLTAPRYGLL